MAGKTTLTLEQKLTQRLSPIQLQLVPLLEMTNTEFDDRVKEEIDDNPALEVNEENNDDNLDKTEDGDTFNETSDQLQANDYGDDDDRPYTKSSYSGGNSNDMPDPVVVAESTLSDYLLEQIHERDLTEKQSTIAEYIIGNLEDNGYLTRSTHAIADDITFGGTGLVVDTPEVDAMLNMVRELDPPGIAATDLRDCLLLQLKRKPDTEVNRLAYEIIDKHFDIFSKKHFDKICAVMNIDNAKLKEVLTAISALNPKPGNAFNGSTSEMHSQQITPDFEVDADNDDLTLTLLNNVPELQIAQSYSEINDHYSKQKPISRREKDEATEVRRCYDKASSFIKVMKMRQETLFNTMSDIVRRQHDFFVTGDETLLKPMILKDIANDTGYDVSVISRATSNKYVTTPWGVYPLKFFFSEGLSHESGEDVSSLKIKKLLKDIIDNEDKRRPVSDQRLCLMLRNKGYDIARRTVTKYRKQMSIPVARLRRGL
jgi:RNA polymerase sigma-54 factor